MSFIAGTIDITLSLDADGLTGIPGTMVCTAPTTPAVIAETTVN
jgi:hypothetical protein